MTTLDPRGLEAAARVVAHQNSEILGHDTWVDLEDEQRDCLRSEAAEIITAYLDAAQQVVETVEELEELPVRTVVLCAKDYPLWLNRRTVQGWWYRPGDEEDFSDDEIPLPARVIWRPHESP